MHFLHINTGGNIFATFGTLWEGCNYGGLDHSRYARSIRQARHRHRSNRGAGSGNGVGIGGRGRGGRLGGAQSRQGPCSRGRDPSASGRREGQVRGGGPCTPGVGGRVRQSRSEEHTSELQSLMRNSYAVFCLKKKKERQKREYTQDKIRHRTT